MRLETLTNVMHYLLKRNLLLGFVRSDSRFTYKHTIQMPKYFQEMSMKLVNSYVLPHIDLDKYFTFSLQYLNIYCKKRVMMAILIIVVLSKLIRIAFITWF